MKLYKNCLGMIFEGLRKETPQLTISGKDHQLLSERLQTLNNKKYNAETIKEWRRTSKWFIQKIEQFGSIEAAININKALNMEIKNNTYYFENKNPKKTRQPFYEHTRKFMSKIRKAGLNIKIFEIKKYSEVVKNILKDETSIETLNKISELEDFIIAKTIQFGSISVAIDIYRATHEI